MQNTDAVRGDRVVVLYQLVASFYTFDARLAPKLRTASEPWQEDRGSNRALL